MGRHASFDKDKVLDNALMLFWSRGFAASSLRQLEEVTDLHPGSLYHHFQSKEGLYLCALEHYISHYLHPRIEKHLISGNPIEGLRRFLTSGYRHSREEQYRNCCFVACTSTELHLLPETASQLVNLALDDIQQALSKQVSRFNSAPPQSNLDLASELTNFFLGLQLMARIKANQHQLDQLVKCSLQHILQRNLPG